MKRYLLVVADAILPTLALVLASLDVVPEWRLPRNLLVIAMLGLALYITFYLVKWFYHAILLPEPTKSNRNKVLLISILLTGMVFTMSFISAFRLLIPKSYEGKDGVRELVYTLESPESPFRYFVFEYTTKPEARRVYIILKSKKSGLVMDYKGIADFPADTAYLSDSVIVVEQFSTGTSQRFDID